MELEAELFEELMSSSTSVKLCHSQKLWLCILKYYLNPV